MQRHPRTRCVAQPSRKPVVIRMNVGDQRGTHVRDRVAGMMQPALEGRPCLVGVPSGVDDGNSIVELEGVHEHVAQRILRNGNGDRPETRAHLLDWREHVSMPGALLSEPGHLEGGHVELDCPAARCARR